MKLSSIKNELIFFSLLVVGGIFDIFIFAGVVVLGGGVFLAQWLGLSGGLLHGVLIWRYVSPARNRGGTWGAGAWGLALVATGFVIIGSAPLLIVAGYLTDSLWLGKFFVTFLTCFLQVIFRKFLFP
jgi:hypothetical protein